MDQLPLEMVHHILHFLPLKDRIQNRLVCKTFRDLIPNLQLSQSERSSLKKSFFELGAICLVPEIIMGGIDIIQPFKFQIVGPTGQIKYRIDISNFRSGGQIFIRREIILDPDRKFSDLDDLDPFLYYEGLKKFLCSIKNILSLVNKKDTLYVHSRERLWKDMIIQFLLDPISQHSILIKKYETILTSHPSDLDYVSCLSYLITDHIYQILNSRFKQIRKKDRKKYLELLLIKD